MKNRSIRSTLPSTNTTDVDVVVAASSNKTTMRKSHKNDLKTYYDNLIESRKSLIIKLKYPQMPAKEIYDLDYLQLDSGNRPVINENKCNNNSNVLELARSNSIMSNGNYSSISSSSSSSSSSNNNHNVTSGTGSSANSCSSVLSSSVCSTRLSNGNVYDGYRFKPSSPSSLTTSSSSSASSNSSYSNRASFDSNDFKLSINNNLSSSEHFIASPPPQQQQQSMPRQPAQFARHSTFNSQHESINNFGYDDSNDESFTFKDFVSSIINNPNEELHVMIIQDIARLLELKFRDFVKSISKTNLLRKRSNQDQTSNSNNSQIYLNGDSNLFTQIGENIFRQALEEPNGILGARLKLRFQLLDGRTFDCCESFAYDSTTMPTSELIVILKEQLTETRKFLNRFRFLAASFEKYCSTHVDTSNYDIIKNRLY